MALAVAGAAGCIGIVSGSASVLEVAADAVAGWGIDPEPGFALVLARPRIAASP